MTFSIQNLLLLLSKPKPIISIFARLGFDFRLLGFAQGRYQYRLPALGSNLIVVVHGDLGVALSLFRARTGLASDSGESVVEISSRCKLEIMKRSITTWLETFSSFGQRSHFLDSSRSPILSEIGPYGFHRVGEPRSKPSAGFTPGLEPFASFVHLSASNPSL